jgi:hypothetical protein
LSRLHPLQVNAYGALTVLIALINSTNQKNTAGS